MKKKERLSRGLDFIFDNESDVAAKSEKSEENLKQSDNIKMVKISLIEPNRKQPRRKFDNEKLSELADSIRENGIIQPITVRSLDNGGYQIVAGERRWRASRLAGLEEIPVYIKTLDERQTMQLALIENIQRDDLTPLEEASAYQQLMDSYDLTQTEVAKIVGKSRSVVANSLRLLGLTEEVRSLIEDGTLSLSHAKILAGLGEQDQVKFGREIQQTGMSVRELEISIARQESAEKEQELKKQTEDEKAVRDGSVKKERPFLKEFEVSVNTNSNVRVKADPERGGGVKLTMKIGRETDIEAVLSRLAEVLEEY